MEVRKAKVGNQVFRFGWSEIIRGGSGTRGQWFVSVEEGKASSRSDKGPGRSGVRGGFIIDPLISSRDRILEWDRR